MRSEKFSLRFLTFLLNSFWRALWILNAFLLATTAVLSVVLCVSVFVDTVPIPRVLKEIVEREAMARGVEVKFDSAKISLDATLYVYNAELRIEGTPEPFLTASKIELSLWPAPLLARKLRLREARIYDAAIGSTFEGARKSPALDKIYLKISQSGRWFDVEALNLRWGRVAIEASGLVGQNFSASEFIQSFYPELNVQPNAPDSPYAQAAANDAVEEDLDGSAAKKLDDAVAKISAFKKYSEMFADPVLILKFKLCGGGENTVGALLRATKAHFSIKGNDAQIKNLELELNLTAENAMDDISARLSAENFSAENLPSCDNMSAQAYIIPNENGLTLSDIDIAAKKIYYEGMSVDNVSLRKNYLDSEDVGSDWRVFAAIDIYRLGAKISFDKNFSAVAEFSGNLNPDWILKRKEFAKIKELKGFSFPQGINLSGAAAYDRASKTIRAKASAEAQNCVAIDIPVNEVRADLSFDSSKGDFSASNVKVETKEGWEIGGSYKQNFESNKYTIRLSGNIQPMKISSIMAKWWERVMGSFNFEGERNFPSADIFVDGTWGNPDYIWCFISANGRDVIYHGETFDSFSLKVWVNPERISLYDISIISDNRRAHGLVEWLYGNEGLTSYDKQDIHIVSTLNSSELAALGGADAKEVLDVLRFENAPSLTFNASLQNSHKKSAKRDAFNLDAFASGNTKVEMATLTNLRFKARSDSTLTIVDEASFGFCGGQASGSLNLLRKEKGMDFKADIFAEKMNQQKFFDFLESLDKDGTEVSDPAAQNDPTLQAPAKKKRDAIIQGGETGEITMTASLSGNTSNFERSYGSGYLNIDNRDLIILNLFGAISRASSALGLPFGSFDITYLNSTFFIKDGVLSLPKLEMGGPVMQIKGAASYDFINDDINSTLAILPFGGLEMPLVSRVMSVINPLTNAVQADVDGKISDPKVSLKVNPINILQSDRKILESIRSEF